LIGTGSQAEGDEGRLPEESGVFGRVRLPVLRRPDHLLAGVDTDGFFSGWARQGSNLRPTDYELESGASDEQGKPPETQS